MPEPRYVISMGVVRQRRRLLPLFLCRRARLRPHRARRHLRARLPADGGGAASTASCCCSGRSAARARSSAEPARTRTDVLRAHTARPAMTAATAADLDDTLGQQIRDPLRRPSRITSDDRPWRADRDRARDRILEVLNHLRDDAGLPLRGADRHLRRRLAGARQPLRRRLPPALPAPCTSASASRLMTDEDDTRAQRDRRLSRRQLVRAGGLRHVRHPVRRPPRPAPPPDRLRLPGLSAAQGLSRSPATSRCATTTS